MREWATWLALGQGTYFLVAGAWPILSMRSFEAVTGPKTDDWLVKTVGTLVAVIGLALIQAGAGGRVAPETVTLAVGCALGLAIIDAWYVARGVIPRVYLADAAVEAALIAAWIAALATS